MSPAGQGRTNPGRDALRFGVLALVVLAAAPAVLAEDVPGFVDRGKYERVEDFRTQGATVRSFAARDDAATAGWYYFLVRAEGDDGWSYAYRLDRGPLGGSAVRLDLYQVNATSPTPDADLSRVAGVRMQATDAAAARALVVAAEAAGSDWDDHARYLEQAYRSDRQASHRAWRRVVTSLERARERHPRHLGILHDLIVAYTHLSAFEHESTQGANVSRLLPARTAELEAVGGHTPMERRTLLHARAMHYVRCGLYPLAGALIREAPGDADLETVRRVMAALGQVEFTDREGFTVEGAAASYDVRVVETQGEPPSGELLHDELYFLPRLQATAGPVGRVWYVLSRQALDASARYYLYGCSGRSRALLMMYGKDRPAYDQVRADVERVMTRALSRRPGSDGEVTWRRLITGAIAAAFVLLAIVLGRRLGWFRSTRHRGEVT